MYKCVSIGKCYKADTDFLYSFPLGKSQVGIVALYDYTLMRQGLIEILQEISKEGTLRFFAKDYLHKLYPTLKDQRSLRKWRLNKTQHVKINSSNL